ncbi:MAG: hypothetical protein PHZ07_01155 [Patescibacteria group bacterium]|nr:hypothetical protein [Patescibacteria group bacterium]MDD4303955.1 hypothetical protein [Patescibacteria group bacterium]MDD4695056.1 hypothetical protein [Patescibacteria group bacterium]
MFKKITLSLITITVIISIFQLSIPTTQATGTGGNTSIPNIPNLKNSKTILDTSAVMIGFDTSKSIEATIGNVIKIALSLIGILFLILIIIAGFQWMTAGGNEETVTKSKARIKNSANGLLIILGAYMVTYFILDIVLKQTLK